MQVFISYPSDDKALAELVADMCREYGHEPFVAEESPKDLMGGAGWLSGLCATIDRCDALILCLSEHSLQSHFQKIEWSYAISQCKERPFVVTRRRGPDARFYPLYPTSNLYQWVWPEDPARLAAIREYFKARCEKLPDEERFQWMQQVAVEAGIRLTTRYGVGRHSGPPQLLDQSKNCATNFDVAIERFILKDLGKHYPGEPVLAEESVEKRQFAWEGDPNAEWIWTVDAIDGTLNFLAGDDRYCCGVGLLRHGKPHLGAVFVPSQMLLYAGGVGRPATVRNLRDGALQTLKADAKMKKLDECWTLTHVNSRPEEVERGFAHDIPRRLHDAVRRVWMWGCGLISLSALARGTHHLFAQRVIWPWDIVPGLALVHAAGGVSSVWPDPDAKPWTFTGELQSDVIAACNEDVLRAAAAALAVPAGPARGVAKGDGPRPGRARKGTSA